MTTSALKTTAITFVPALVTMLVMQACGGGNQAIAQAVADPMEGVWESVVTVRDCTTNATLGTFRGLQVLHRGGTLSDTNSSAPSTRGPGVGVWSRQADGVYEAKFRFYRYNPDGRLAGMNLVTSQRTLSADGKGYSGTALGEVLNLDGAVLSSNCVSDVGTRLV